MCRLKRIVKGLPLAELRILLSDPFMTGLNVTLLYPVHPAVGLEHQSIQNSLIFYSLTWQHSLQQMFIHSNFQVSDCRTQFGELGVDV